MNDTDKDTRSTPTETSTKKSEFPRYVFKRGTGRLVDDEQKKYEAEARLVHDEDELSRLGDGWLDSPKEASMGPNVTNANVTVTDKGNGTVSVEPKAGHEGHVDKGSDLHRRTLVDQDELKRNADDTKRHGIKK